MIGRFRVRKLWLAIGATPFTATRMVCTEKPVRPFVSSIGAQNR